MQQSFDERRAETIEKFFDLIYRDAPTECWSTLGITTNEGSIKFELFQLSELRKAKKWAMMESDPDNVNGQKEIYTRILPIRPECRLTKGRRGGEKDSAGTSVLWVELDFDKTTHSQDEVLKALRSFEPQPTAIIFSGGGYHVYWKLSTFEQDTLAVKRRTLGLSQKLKAYGADDCYDLARILRVPGTWNLKYKEPIFVDFMDYNPERVYSLDNFPTVEYEEQELDFDFEEEPLPKDFEQRIKDAGKSNPAYRNLWDRIETGEGAEVKDDGTLERSDSHWYIVRSLLELGYSRGQCLTVLTNPNWFASAKTFRIGPDGSKIPDWNYAKRTIANAWVMHKKQEDEKKQSPMRFFREGGGFVPVWLGEEILKEENFLTMGGRKGELWHYKKGVFRPGGESYLSTIIAKKLLDEWKPERSNAVIQWVKDMTIYSPLENSKESNLVNVLNGMLQITTEEVKLLPHSPDYKSLSQLPVEYDPDAPVEEVREFFGRILPMDAVPAFEEFLGTCLLTDYRFKKALLLVGNGDSGKSTLLKLVSALLGEENVSSRTFQDLAGGNRFAKASLVGKLANVYADLPQLTARDIGQFKALTGDDKIDAEFKGKDAVSFYNYAKLFFSANAYPTVKSPDDAFFDRWIVIFCPNRFVDSEDRVDEKSGRYLKDRTILDRLTTPEKLSGALNLAVAGLQRLIRNGKFTESTSIERARYEFISCADSVLGFFNACSEPDAEAQAAKDEWYHAYRAWCNAIGAEIVSSNQFFRRVKELKGQLGLIEIENTTIPGRQGLVSLLRGRKLYEFATVADGTKVRIHIPVR